MVMRKFSLATALCTLLYPNKESMIFVRGFSSRAIIGKVSSASSFGGSRSLSSILAASESSSDVKRTRPVTSLPPVPENAHRIVLMRHGESEFNNANIFTGWCDVALTPRGRVEAYEAGEVFLSHHLTFRQCYCSMLTRAIVTAQRALQAGDVSYTPISYDWRLNERHYGALQGLSKERTADRLGREKTMRWRRSYDVPPPEMTKDHPHFDIINNDARYRKLDKVPRGESLEGCQVRVLEAWKEIVQDAKDAEDDTHSAHSLIVAHANTLRALVMSVDNIPASDIEDLNIPTGIPFYYNICKTTGEVLPADDDGTEMNHISDMKGFRGTYISDDRKKRSFLERRRAANDPWLWALHDDQVTTGMLEDDGGDGSEEQFSVDESAENLAEMAIEALENTELFSSITKGKSK